MKQPTAKNSHRFLTVALPLLAIFGTISNANADAPEDSAAKGFGAQGAEGDLKSQMVNEARAYLDEWNAKGAAACEARDPTCPKLAESLYNAAVSFQAAGDREKAMSARQLLLNPRYHVENTSIAQKAMFQLADDYKTLTEYARAADQYEAAVQRAPASAEAPDALLDATVLHLASGNMARATKNAENYDKVFGAKKPSMAVTIWLAVALTHLEREQISEAKSIFEKIMGRLDRAGELRDRFVAHAGFGRALNTAGDVVAAEREYEVVRGLWQDPENQKRVLGEAETNPRSVAKVLTAVGEAMFFFAEQKRKEADAIRYPIYTGSADKAAVMKHINTKVVDWMKKKRSAIEVAENKYRLILDLQPAPPPQWVVAASSRVGTMWGTYVAEFRAAPIPKEWTKKGPVAGVDDLTYEEIRKTYYESIDEAVEPNKKHAKASFKMCVDLSVKYQYVDEFSRKCGAWLEKHYPKEHVAVTEFIPPIRTQSWNLGWTMVLPDPRANP